MSIRLSGSFDTNNITYIKNKKPQLRMCYYINETDKRKYLGNIGQ